MPKTLTLTLASNIIESILSYPTVYRSSPSVLNLINLYILFGSLEGGDYDYFYESSFLSSACYSKA